MIDQIIYLMNWLTIPLSCGTRKPVSQLIEVDLSEDDIALLIIALAEKLQKEVDSLEKKGGQDDSSTILP